MADAEAAGDVVARWTRRFLDDLAVVRSANTVRAYRADVARWVAFCAARGVHPFEARPRTAIDFIRSERERSCGDGRTVSARTIVRRLSAVRQWYAYLALAPEETGVERNPVPAGNAIRTGAGAVAGKPALLRYDAPLPQTLSGEEFARFVACLTATRHRDRAIVWLLKDGGVRIGELLALRVGDVDWSKRTLTVRAPKTRSTRLVPVTAEAIAVLADYVRRERPRPLPHDYVFVNLGRRGFGQPFRYRSWVAVCETARQAAGTPHVHAHAFRHTLATNLTEGGMALDALQRLLGHRSLDTVMVYNRVRDGLAAPRVPASDGGRGRRLRPRRAAARAAVVTAAARPFKLTAADRRVIARDRYSRADRARVTHLLEPYEEVFRRHVARDSAAGESHRLWRSFRLCAQAMLDLDCTYWAFTWERLLAWREMQERSHTDRSPGWWQNWHTRWTEVTATLFFLEVLPYREEIYRANHMELAYKWLGRDAALAIQERFVEMGRAIGYRHGRQLLGRGAAVVLTVLTAKRSTDLAGITRADLAGR